MSENEPLVEVTRLSKKFCKDLKTSLWYGVQDLLSGYAGNSEERRLRPKEFWAVKDISFTLKRGECLGLIGHNGAGKSTLLKILNGLINPDAGKVVIRGRVGALIELGAGFNPVLSGRENIYNNGAILGFSKREIDSNLEEIIAFAELQEFIDMPVRNYSSGMKVRLGFAIAAQMQPDVLIIDEVLAVGDLGFVLKCFRTIDAILPNTAIIFVSHSMPMVSRICNQVILMDRGEAKFQGDDVSKGIDLYYSRFANNERKIVYDDGSLELKGIEVFSDKKIEGCSVIKWGETLQIAVYFRLGEGRRGEELMCTLTLLDKEQRPIAVISNLIPDNEHSNGEYALLFTHERVQLSKGVYSISVSFSKNGTPIYRSHGEAVFQVSNDKVVWVPFQLENSVEVIE